MRAKTAALKLDLESQSIPVVVSIQSSSQRQSIWEESLNSNTSSSIQTQTTPTVKSYSSVVKNTTTQVNPPDANQTGNQQQQYQ